MRGASIVRRATPLFDYNAPVTADPTEFDSAPGPRRRRPRYPGTHPRRFEQRDAEARYEHDGRAVYIARRP